jgi:phospholipid/cholesterol/gamma-HCH transport system substrate-binding protein
MSTFKAGVIGIVVVVVFTYLGFTKFANPFASPFTVRAIFPNANGLVPDNLVRIAGINVGKVTGVKELAGKQASEVTMEIDDNGLPLHNDATFQIRPRIFLEGNFFVAINPGTPNAPTVHSDFTFPESAGSEPVQLDQVLTSLQADTRHNLQLLLQEFGSALVKGGPAYNASIQYWLPAYEYSSMVNHDALGIQPHDLSNWIGQMATVSGALDANPHALQSLITDFNTTASAFARQRSALEQAVGELPNTLAAATPALNSLNAAFPPLRRFANALDPGVRSSGPAIDASLPFIHQLRLLVQPAELRGLASDLTVAVPALAQLTRRTIPFMRDQVRPASSCVANNIYPWSQATVPDKNFTAANGFPSRPVYVEAVDFLPGLAGESRDFDANGPYIRILGGGGTLTYSLAPGLFGTALSPLTNIQPQLPPNGTRPPLHARVACETQPVQTDLSASMGTLPAAIDTSSSNPGLPALNRDSQQAAITELRKVITAQHLPYRVADLPGLKK